MNDTINTDTLLPVGERLKPLLSKSCISESDMKNLLAERGVYIGNSDKKLSIPILTLSILSPREFEKLQEIIAEVLNVDPEEITPDTTFVDDLGADSLDIFQIIMGIEEEFDIEIDNDAAEKIVTVRDAVNQIKNVVD